MSTRAAIYIRVSSEKQGEKISPEAQEADCRALCQAKGYQVVAIYRDVEKYRVGSRMVEPSGTRADRPALKQMLADARAGKFEIIIAWREDRLYRSYRPMLEVLDCLEETKIDIELAKETFDRRIAPVKAWAAKMELDARKDRVTMGMAGRFTSGKIWPASIPYGYRKGADGKAEINPEEARWAQAIWEWKAAGKNNVEIRRLLIENHAPQRRRELCKFPWQRDKIKAILHHDVYYTGIQKINWGGRVYEIEYPKLVDGDIARAALLKMEQLRRHPAKHLKHNYLGLGLVHCATCGNKMVSMTSRAYRRKGKLRNRINRHYRCQNHARGNHVPNCARQVMVKQVDAQLWDKVKAVLTNEEDLEYRVQQRVDELRRAEGDAQTEVDRIKHELGTLVEERQWVITEARKKRITEEDMDRQLGMLSQHEDELKRELAEKSLLIGNRAERLLEFARRYRATMQGKLEWLFREPQTPEEAQKQFEARREIVEAIVKRINVFPDKSIKVDFEFDFAGGDEISDRQSL